MENKDPNCHKTPCGKSNNYSNRPSYQIQQKRFKAKDRQLPDTKKKLKRTTSI